MRAKGVDPFGTGAPALRNAGLAIPGCGSAAGTLHIATGVCSGRAACLPVPEEGTPIEDKASQRLRRAGLALSARAASLEDVLAGLSAGGFGLVLAALATPNLLPSPGVPIGLILGIPLLLLAAQFTCGADRPTIPGWLGRHRRAGPLIGRALRWLAPRVRWWERRVGHRPLRWPHAVRRVVGGGWVMLMAVLIILPIPFGNSLPALSSVLLGSGLFMNDRSTVLAGFGAGIAAIVFAIAVGAGAWQLAVLALS
ncbi:MAG TPA: exopolysaccharide biosynthesis protein [Rhodospirillales bacterium]|nr:exopolysaccharide biosynthesis protein [Rhodospirillales bacterium]